MGCGKVFSMVTGRCPPAGTFYFRTNYSFCGANGLLITFMRRNKKREIDIAVTQWLLLLSVPFH
jgi:hypothetical protein